MKLLPILLALLLPCCGYEAEQEYKYDIGDRVTLKTGEKALIEAIAPRQLVGKGYSTEIIYVVRVPRFIHPYKLSALLQVKESEIFEKIVK
jgi:hypothetical protein